MSSITGAGAANTARAGEMRSTTGAGVACLTAGAGEMYSTTGPGAACSAGAGEAQLTAGAGEVHFYHRSRRSVSYGWSWRDVLVDRRQCSIHSRCWRSIVGTGCRTDALH